MSIYILSVPALILSCLFMHAADELDHKKSLFDVLKEQYAIASNDTSSDEDSCIAFQHIKFMLPMVLTKLPAPLANPKISNLYTLLEELEKSSTDFIQDKKDVNWAFFTPHVHEEEAQSYINQRKKYATQLKKLVLLQKYTLEIAIEKVKRFYGIQKKICKMLNDIDPHKKEELVSYIKSDLTFSEIQGRWQPMSFGLKDLSFSLLHG